MEISNERAKELLSLGFGTCCRYLENLAYPPFYARDLAYPHFYAQDLRDLIELAAYDLKRMIQGTLMYGTKTVKPDMSTYGKEEENTCYACLAGAVFLDVYGKASWLDNSDWPSLRFLDRLRVLNENSNAWDLLSKAGFRLPEFSLPRSPYRGYTGSVDPQEILRALEGFLELNPKEDVKTPPFTPTSDITLERKTHF